ncbi:hypothetical protein [Shimwellia blattae]|uniref:hypothetical protein n=1 Tax=Shimwellia blattae TaxID=563 RepID=UPI000291B317|nr:hypothetical protein [Shimwellia blattae]GAB83237.1 hypothetical protein EB105725_59_00040 [Shimwellia blattae DSM 4481 = NBRC 105725]
MAHGSWLMAHASETVGCFSAGKTNVKFIQISQDGLGIGYWVLGIGYVKYECSKSAIPLLFVKTEEQDSADRHLSFTTDWNEILNEKVSSYYKVISYKWFLI